MSYGELLYDSSSSSFSTRSRYPELDQLPQIPSLLSSFLNCIEGQRGKSGGTNFFDFCGLFRGLTSYMVLRRFMKVKKIKKNW